MNTRRQEILRHIGTGTCGIEVAPWFKPIIPRGEERKVVVLDLFDRPTLLARAENDPNIDRAMIPQIGEVDLVGSACDIAGLARARFGSAATFDFVVSSHNFEHLPDPVRFLRGCEALLTQGGMVSMAVPDKRACFDFFRPPSRTGEMLQAYHEHRARPSFAQVFDQGAYNATLRTSSGCTGVFTIDEDPGQIALRGDLVRQYEYWLQQRNANDGHYHDTHCWTFTPSSLELILTELAMIGLINFDIVSVTRPSGCEFIVHLRKRAADDSVRSALAGRRELLLRQIADELAHVSRYARKLRAEPETPHRKLFMVHIPKTGGETVNYLLAEILGGEQVLIHVESAPGVLTILQSVPPAVRYISGHLRLPEVLARINGAKWFVFANLRNPVRHLVSHLKWMKALGHPDAGVSRHAHSASVQEMTRRLWEISLNDIEGIHRFINEEFNDAKQFFDNCQVRYLIDYHDRLLCHADAAEAVEALSGFDYVGLTETLSDTLTAITTAAGVSAEFDHVPVRNQSPLAEVVDLDDSAIRDFYREAVKLDAFLYTAAKKRIAISKGFSVEKATSQ